MGTFELSVGIGLLIVVAGLSAAIAYRFGAHRMNRSIAVTERDAGSGESPSRHLIPSEQPTSTHVWIESAEGARLFSMSSLDESTFLRGNHIELPSESMDKLSPLLHVVPAVAAASQVAESTIYEVVISGDLIAAKGVPDGFRAIARGADGISEHAVLFKTESLSAVVGSTVVWNLASALVAQKHLADISEKLDKIEKSIANIEFFQTSERGSRIAGALKYFIQQARPTILGEQGESSKIQIEAKYADLLEIEDHLIRDLKRRIEVTIPGVTDSGKWGSEVFRGAIASELDGFEATMEQWLLCNRAQQQAWCLQALSPGNPELKRQRLQALHESLRPMTGSGGLVRRAIEQLEAKVDAIDSKVERADTLRRHRTRLRERVSGCAISLGEQLANSRAMTGRADQIFSELSGPVRLALKARDGRIVEARTLAEDSSLDVVR